MRDMGPRGDRSIRNIPVPASHRRPHLDVYEEEGMEAPPRRRRRMGGWFLWAALIVVAVGAVGGVLLSTVFAGAAVSVTPKSATVTPPASLAAFANAPAGSLSYQVVTTSRSASTTVPATGSSQVSRAASGVITVYNGYSTASQRLIANTRFEAPDGKIYRIHASIVVPGAAKAADGTLTPGSTSATAYADSPGESYNRGATTFTIPGFQGDPRYNAFSAKTDGMTGGFIGMEPTVSSDDLAQAKTLLEQSLSGALNDAVATQIPKEYVAIPGSIQISYGAVTQTAGSGGNATLSQSATATADVLRLDDLAAAIAKQTVQDYNGEAVTFADPAALVITLATSSAAATGPLELRLSGSPTLLWQFDPDTLKQALLGKDKGQFETIIASFAPAIECTKESPCSASIRPFWSGSFPSNPDKITISTRAI